jgi:hypothetical protein
MKLFFQKGLCLLFLATLLSCSKEDTEEKCWDLHTVISTVYYDANNQVMEGEGASSTTDFSRCELTETQIKELINNMNSKIRGSLGDGGMYFIITSTTTYKEHAH